MIYCSESFPQISFRVSVFNSRNIYSCHVRFSSSNYVDNCLIYRLPGNEISNFNSVAELKFHVFNSL